MKKRAERHDSFASGIESAMATPFGKDMEMNGKVQRVLLVKTCRCLPTLRTKSIRILYEMDGSAGQ